jgi:SAM-dependent methyltransferase
VNIRNFVDAFTRILGKLKKNNKVKLKGQSIKLNLGCGLAIYGDWINIDGSLNALIASCPGFVHRFMYRQSGANRYYSQEEYCQLLGQHRFIHHDLSYGIPTFDNSADFVYSSHFLEHLFRNDAQNLLNESLRILKPGGVVRICVPDLEYAVAQYSAGKKKAMLESYFFVDDDNSYYARHKYMYDFQMLQDLLILVGFRDIKRCEFQQGLTPDLDHLDNRSEDSLYVEAIK